MGKIVILTDNNFIYTLNRGHRSYLFYFMFTVYTSTFFITMATLSIEVDEMPLDFMTWQEKRIGQARHTFTRMLNFPPIVTQKRRKIHRKMKGSDDES